MPDGTPATPPTQPQSDPTEESKFQAWFRKYLDEHEGAVQPHPSTSQNSQSGTDIAAAVEAALSRREAKNRQTTRLDTVEKESTAHKAEIEALKSALAKPKKKSIFSIFG